MTTAIHKNNEARAKFEAERGPGARRQQAEYRRKRVGDWVASMQKSVEHYFSANAESEIKQEALTALVEFAGVMLRGINAQEEQ